ncbi:MAG: bifunctional 5,10-methylenetetrahydrofolate dehydrogenase/5,10-methenyltetrahydrofolate cyclohydrolase [Oligoflexia bacterium]|nr:bifunctional 5,10-methylenetetrahydrofolate dehydrogenase/5,10-methenyltetrahydrofolate cyclohydrolase [Oligoflexia bacterium]
MIELLAKPVVERIQSGVSERAANFAKAHGRKPKLTVVLVGENAASVIYTRKKGETAIKLGMESEIITFPWTATPEDVKTTIDRLNADPKVDGILIQRPLPPSFKEEEVLYWVTPSKDVDAFHPINAGRLMLGLPSFQPCTPAGVMEILKHYSINPSGKLACVIGRSSIVGKPMAALLLQANATILHTHSKTPDLKAICRQADIVIAAIGKAQAINSDYIKDGAVVIDVGINRTPAGKVVGDVAYDEVAQKCSAITPVPGGVGPMTIAILLENTVWAAEQAEAAKIAR